tara:strand:- start:1886 stop:2467 length:582 start_codon:yes stop_codon:yes gene_type:complete
MSYFRNFKTNYFTSTKTGKIHTPHVITVDNPEIGIIVSRYLDTVGNGTGTKQALGNYATATPFFITPGVGEVYDITRLIVYIEDSSGMDNAKYGNIAALTNGITINSVVGGVTDDMTDGLAIKTNGQWKRVCYDQHIDSTGAGNDSCAARWTFSASGVPIRLSYGDTLSVVCHDDFTGLIDHTFKIQGHIETA